jgi:hypothetical protein
MRLSLRRGRHSQAGAPTTRGRSAAKRAVCAVIACAAAVPLAAGAHSDVHLTKQYTSPAWTSEFTQAYQVEECLYHAIRSAVPRGAPIYITNSYAGHTQLLAELSTLWAVPQENQSAADWALSILHGTPAGLRHKHRRFMTYRYCPAETLLGAENLAQARQARRGAAVTEAHHARKSRRVRQS